MEENYRDFLVVIGYVYLQHGATANAADVLETVHMTRPHDRCVARLLAYAYLQLRRYQECLDLTDFLLAGHDDREPQHVRLFRSRALYGLGRQQEAKEYWTRSRNKR